jgi:hypothetical protein
MRRAERWQVLHSDIVHGAVGQSRALLLHMIVQKQHFAKKDIIARPNATPTRCGSPAATDNPFVRFPA